MPNSKLGEGVHDVYKERARMGGDVLWHCTIRGQSELTDGIPLHMSLKVFNDKKDMDMAEIKKKVKELDIKTPDPKKLKFSTKIFTSEVDGKKYYMLMIDGVDENYAQFYNEMKHCGTVYKSFMPHVTIDQNLFDSINERPLEASEIVFSDLTIEEGAGNTVHEFGKSEEALEKGFVRNAAIGMSIAAGLMSGTQETKPMPHPTMLAQPKNTYSAQKMLNTIAHVESSSGKKTNHAAVDGQMHQGEAAYGKYGLMPTTIRETVKLHGDLKQKHKKVLALQGQDLHNYMEDNPGLEDEVAKRHLSRLEHHFGQDPEKIGYSWLNGIRGGYQAEKKKLDVKNHWHVKKIKQAYDSGE